MYLNCNIDTEELLENISSVGLSPSSILSSRLDAEFDLAWVFAFFCVFFEVSLSGLGVVVLRMLAVVLFASRDEKSERCLLVGFCSAEVRLGRPGV